jgi:mannitol/fructose-specific phosphotransferase system IIA component
MELARCRAQKLAAMQQLRQAFGRKQAVERLNDTLKAEQKRARSRPKP